MLLFIDTTDWNAIYYWSIVSNKLTYGPYESWLSDYDVLFDVPVKNGKTMSLILWHIWMVQRRNWIWCDSSSRVITLIYYYILLETSEVNGVATSTGLLLLKVICAFWFMCVHCLGYRLPPWEAKPKINHLCVTLARQPNFNNINNKTPFFHIFNNERK